MTVVSNDPSWWPLINSFRFFSYFVVASCAAVIYDWALTFGQEFELIWRQHWSPMTLLYLGVRYLGMPYTVIYMLLSLLSVSVTDVVSTLHKYLPFLPNKLHFCVGVSGISDGPHNNNRNSCHIMFTTLTWMTVVTNSMLGVILVTRLHAMYQQSRNILVFLVVVLLAITITCGVMAAIGLRGMIWEELVLSGTYQCNWDYGRNAELMDSMAWILYAAWEILALCLAVWTAVKHFRAPYRPSAGWTVGNCFTVLIKTHVAYFASFVAVSCFQLGFLSSVILESSSVGSDVYSGILEFLLIAQMFVLGPRLILSIREFNAKLVANSDAGIDMPPIVFQERGDISTGSDV